MVTPKPIKPRRALTALATVLALAFAGGLAAPSAASAATSSSGVTPAGTANFTAAATSGKSYVEGNDEAAVIFDPLVINRVDITLPQASRDALQADGKGAYQPAQMVFTTANGPSQKLDVGLRLKGGIGSYRNLDQKAGLKVKMNFSVKGQKLFGIKKFTFNNMVQDASMLHEATAYRLFRAMGVPAPRVGYVRVFINDIDYGLHLNIETYDSVSLKRWFKSTQHLYEGAYWTQDIIDSQYTALQIDEGDLNNRDDLKALASVNNLTGKDWFDQVQKYLDINEFVKEIAVERYSGHWDGYAWTIKNNYYAHSDKNGVFSILPWGTDQTWGGWVDFYSYGGIGTLAERCLTYSPCLQLYKGALLKVHDVAATLDLPTQVTDVWQSISNDIISDPRKEQSYEAGVWTKDTTVNALNWVLNNTVNLVNSSNAAGAATLNHSSNVALSYAVPADVAVGSKISPTITRDGGTGALTYQVVNGTQNCSVGFATGVVTIKAMGYCRVSVKAAAAGEWAASINYADLMAGKFAGKVTLAPIPTAKFGELTEIQVTADSSATPVITATGACTLVDSVFISPTDASGTCNVSVTVPEDGSFLEGTATLAVPLSKGSAPAKPLTRNALYKGKLPVGGELALTQIPESVTGACSRTSKTLTAKADVSICVVKFGETQDSKWVYPAVTYYVQMVPATQGFLGSFAQTGGKKIGATKLILARQAEQVTSFGATGTWSSTIGCSVTKEQTRVTVKLKGKSSCVVTLKAADPFGLPAVIKKWVLSY